MMTVEALSEVSPAMEHDFSNLLSQDIERAILYLETHLNPGIPETGLTEWMASSLQWIHTLQTLSAVKGMAHLETYSAQLQKLFTTASNERETIARMLLETDLPRIRQTFREATVLYREGLQNRPKFSKKLNYFVESLYELEHQDPARLYAEPDSTLAQRRHVNLDVMLRSFVPWVQRTAASQDKSVDVRLEMTTGIQLSPEVTPKIQTILVHLLKNAVTHGLEPEWTRRILEKDARGHITLGATLERGYLKLMVTDDGCGMDENNESCSMFNQLQANSATAEPSASDNTAVETSIYSAGNYQSGLGVGLHVVTCLVDRLEGEFDIQTEPNQGTTVTVKLPLANLKKA